MSLLVPLQRVSQRNQQEIAACEIEGIFTTLEMIVACWPISSLMSFAYEFRLSSKSFFALCRGDRLAQGDVLLLVPMEL